MPFGQLAEAERKLKQQPPAAEPTPVVQAPQAPQNPAKAEFERLRAEGPKPIHVPKEQDPNKAEFERLRAEGPEGNSTIDYLQDRKKKEDPNREEFERLRAEGTREQAKQEEAQQAATEATKVKRAIEPPDNPDEEPPDSWWDRIASVPHQLSEIVPQIYTGVRDAATEAGRAAADLAEGLTGGSVLQITDEEGNIDPQWITRLEAEAKGVKQLPGLPEGPKAETITGKSVKSIAQFVVGFVPASKALKAAKVTNTVVRGAIAGAAADAVVFDPHEARLSNLVQSNPSLRNPVTEYLAANPEDSAAHGRFKNAVEGLIPGIAIDAVATGVKAIARARDLKAASGGKPIESAGQDVRLDFDDLDDAAPAPKVEEPVVPAKEGEQLSLELKDPAPRPKAGDQLTLGLKDPEPAKPAPETPAPKPIEPTDAQPRVTPNIKVGEEFVDPAASAPLFQVGKIKADESAALNINFARLETTDDVQTLIEGVAKSDAVRINQARREIQPHEQTKDLADKLGMTEEQLLQRKVGEAFNSEQIFAARAILIESGERTEALARQAAEPGASPTVLSEFRDALTTHHAIQSQVSGLTAEAGRALQAFRIPAGSRNYRNLVANDNVIAAGGVEKTQDLAKIVLAGGVEKTAKLSGGNRVGDALYETWINGLLSSPATHAANMLGNALNIGLADTTRLAAGGIRASKQLAKKITPNRWLSEEALKEQGVGLGEAGHAIYGQLAAVKEAFQLASKTFKDDFGEELLMSYQRSAFPEGVSALNKAETGLQPAVSSSALGLERSGVAGRAADYLGSIIRTPGKALNASDVFFKIIGYRGELHALAYRQAVDEGLGGAELAARVKQLVDSPTDTLRAEATGAAEYQTFTRPLGESGQNIQRALRSNYFGRVLVPFFKTPTNILKHVGAHSPAALIAPSFRKELLAGGARADVALAKVSVGSGLLAVGAVAALNGHITGGGPAHPDLKARLRETGWQPYSVKVGNKYYSYSRLDPVSSLLGIAADAAEALTQDNDEATNADLATAAVLSVVKNVHSKTWLKGVGDLLEAVNDLSSDTERKNNAVHRYFSRLAGSAVPAGVAAVNRTIDPTLRETGQGWESYINTYKSRIPGLSDSLPPRRNMFGEAVILSGGVGPDIMSPIYVSSDKENPAADEIAKQRTILRMPPKVLDGVELTIEEYDSYVQLAAGVNNPYTRETLRSALENTFNSPNYQRATDGQDGSKSLLIQGVVRDFRQKAKRAFMEDNPRVAAKAMELRRKKEDSLLGR